MGIPLPQPPRYQIAFPTPQAYHSRLGGVPMKPHVPIHSHFLQLAAIAFLATPAFSGTPAKEAAPKYDPATEATFKAVVVELKLVPPTGGKPEAYLVLKAEPAAPQVYLCPKRFLDDMGFEFKAGDQIQVTGSKVTQDGADLTLAREIVKGNDTLILRFKDGKPAW
jgi:hypothetical protein